MPPESETRIEVDLSGEWDFLPTDAAAERLPVRFPSKVVVPGLWEAQGHVDLDGTAWYRRTFNVDDVSGYWSIDFGAVMDAADVYVNGHHVGGHDGAYTPFSVDVTRGLQVGENVIEVRVVDHPLDGSDHRRRAHGKQGWMNHVFPSPPSLYMTYGGIWQPVLLRRSESVRITDVHILCDPSDLQISVKVANRSDQTEPVQITVDVLGRRMAQQVAVSPATAHVVDFPLGDVRDAPRWSPTEPNLHVAFVEVRSSAGHIARQSQRFGLRTFRVHAGRFELNGEPFFVRAALVQGFRADTLYAEGSTEQIRAEVQAAKDAGFNVLRLHVKAFDPAYLDVCDEVGMLVHADIPVAEPIVHDELGTDGELDRSCILAVSEQISRDRNHPSIVMWSTMNELCAEHQESRLGPGYETFARRLYETAAALDSSRPIIENDWIEPDPDRVFCSDVLTAHWYGRLSTPYLHGLALKVRQFAHGHQALYVSEFGDWGLPSVSPDGGDGLAFWSRDANLSAAVGASPWPASVDDFITGTQRYQGMSDRLQGEVVRAGGAAGWCVTELTDVPQEYNGLWTLEREPKRAALAEISRLSQPLLAIVLRTTFTVAAGQDVELPIYICNDGPAIAECELAISLDGETVIRQSASLPAADVLIVPALQVTAPDSPGEYELRLTVIDKIGAAQGINVYPIHVVASTRLTGAVRLIGSAAEADLLASLGVTIDEGANVLVVGETALTTTHGEVVADALRAEQTVVVLRQDVDAAKALPVDAVGIHLATEWGSTPFLFSGNCNGFSAIPPARVLTTEILSIVPDVLWTMVDGEPWLSNTVIAVYKPYPGEVRGTALGQLFVNGGSLWLCQLPLIAAAVSGDVAARSVLTDLLEQALGAETAPALNKVSELQ